MTHSFPTRRSSDLANQDGLDLSSHRARQITQTMCNDADLILVMESDHQRELAARYPLARGKIRCLGELPVGQRFAIAVPYRQPPDAFDQAHAATPRGATNWVQRISQIGRKIKRQIGRTTV